MSKKHPSSSNGITRRTLLKFGLYSTLLGGVPSSLVLNSCSYGIKKPNIVFILIDTLRADHLPTYGYKVNTAPNIQRLADNGVVFERVISPSSWTKTSMASIMTGVNPAQLGVLGIKDKLPGNVKTIAECLHSAGYYTIGVNTNPWLKRRFGFHAGFDIYQTHASSHRSDNFSNASNVNNKALDILSENNQDKPFFLYLHYMDVHAPYRPSPQFFSKKPLIFPKIGPVPDDILEFLYRKKGLRGSAVQQRILDLYDGTILTVDAAINNLLENLQHMDLFENTIFVITADHGESFAEHGTTEHGFNLYPEVYEVPLIFFSPKHFPTGIRIGAQVRSIDIAPTLLTHLGLNVPESFAGNPLLPMKNDAVQNRIALSAVGLNDNIPDLNYAAVVSRDHLYVHEKINNIIEFYDLSSDPVTKNNLGKSHPKAAFYAKLEDDTSKKTTEKTELDQQTINQLKSLGYLQ